MRSPDDERPTDAIDVPPHEELTSRDAPAEERLAPGADVGGYVIDGELGRGGMGIVYAATHPVIGKRAAIKVLRAELSRDPQAVERFLDEARAVNAIGHPNIVDIFAVGKLPDGRSYCAMDLLVGETLRARVKRGPVHISEAASILDEIASALMAAHAAGIIHRDLKPDNIFMVNVPGRWPEVRLLDFGLAKLARRAAGAQPRTLTGSVMGTPAYMSPEQARASDQVDHRTDLYSLGVVAYEVLAGVVPFKKQSSIDTLLAHQEDPVPPLVERVPTVPVELVQLVEAMLAKEPDGRPTLAAVRAVIKRLRGTKIPTMTAAGLQIAPITTTLTAQTSDLDIDSVGGATVVDDRSVSEVMTSPRMKPVLEPEGITDPLTPRERPAPDPITARQRPLPEEPPTARQRRYPQAELADEPPTSRHERYSDDEPPTSRRPPTQQPVDLGARGTPGPERSPMQPALLTTLAGHSMPSASAPNLPVMSDPGASLRAPSYPAAYPIGAVGPMGFPSAAGLLPPEPPEPAPAPQTNRWLVIAIVAIVASALGIALAMLT